MSKRLPYFQFEPAEYLAGDIMFCSYGAQGIFNTICALYWQKDCELKYSQVVKRLGNEDLIKELISEKIIKVDNDNIIINFLDEQYLKATEKAKVNSSNGSKGASKRWRKDSESNSEIIATPLNNDSESIALREDKIKEDKIKEDKIKEDKIKENNSIPINWDDLLLFFNTTTNKKCKVVTEKTKRQFNARLKEGFTKADIKNAILNASKDSYHIETNLKYITLEFISRPDKLEKFCQINNDNIGFTNQKLMTYGDNQ